MTRFPDFALEQVVEVLDAPRPDAHLGVPEGIAHRGDIALRLDQAEQVEGAVHGARVFFRQDPRQQALLVEAAGDEQVVVQRQRVEGPARLDVDVPRHDFRIDHERRIVAAQPRRAPSSP